VPVLVGIGDISFASGGPMPPHSSHKDGRCIDIRPLRKDRRDVPVTIQDPAYDREATRALVASLRSHKNTKKILFNDTQIIGVTPWAGHDNHLHVIMSE
jgi:murein endopeptidase